MAHGARTDEKSDQHHEPSKIEVPRCVGNIEEIWSEEPFWKLFRNPILSGKKPRHDYWEQGQQWNRNQNVSNRPFHDPNITLLQAIQLSIGRITALEVNLHLSGNGVNQDQAHRRSLR